jgi:tetratricopeptide (TPR) repeat protein
MNAAKAAKNDAINDGSDPYELDLAMARAADQADDADAEEQALKDAAAERPEGGEAMLGLGEFYLKQGRFDHAALTLQQVADSEPSARVWFELGRAEEGSFHYYEAEKAYAQAVSFDPKDRSMRAYYLDFKRRMAKEEAQQSAQAGGAAASTPAVSSSAQAGN